MGDKDDPATLEYEGDVIYLIEDTLDVWEKQEEGAVDRVDLDAVADAEVLISEKGTAGEEYDIYLATNGNGTIYTLIVDIDIQVVMLMV